MHVHATQPNPYAQLDALRSAQKTAAKREAESVRKELLESASELNADFSDLSVDADERQHPRRRPRQKNKNNGPAQDKPAGAGAPDSGTPDSRATDSEDAGKHISDWA